MGDQEQAKAGAADSVERFLKWTPVVYASLVFIGYAHMQSYYSAFNIPILRYLSTGELLLSFLDVLGTMAMLVGSVVCFSLLLSIGDEDEEHPTFGVSILGSIVSMLKSLGLLNSGYIILVFTMTTLFLMFEVREYLSIGRGDFISPIAVGIVLAMVAFVFLLMAFWHYRKGANGRAAMAGFGFTFAFVIVWCMMNRSRADDVIEGKTDYLLITVETKRDTVVTNENLVCIGLCNSSIFFWDRTEEAAIIIPTSEVLKTRVAER